MENRKQIATHDGAFHCDEVLAVHMLRQTAAFSNAPVVRSRDEAVLIQADIVVDVGGIYDADAMRFDHHQKTFSGTFEQSGQRSGTKLSSAGLIYKHMGREVVQNVLVTNQIKLRTDEVDEVYLKVYDSFVEAVDAIDNGIPQFDTDQQPRYQSSTDLASRVARLNAAWNEECTPEIQLNRFSKAVNMVGAEFDECIIAIAKRWLPAREIVVKAMASRFQYDDKGRILVMTEWVPWKDHLYAIEDKEHTDSKSANPVQYVVYKDMTGSSWRVQAVPVSPASFTSRTPLPEPWRGVRGDQLSILADISRCIFVHASGFIGGNETYEGAMSMAKKSLGLSAASQ